MINLGLLDFLNELVEQLEKKDPRLFSTRLKTVTDQAYEMKRALETHDLETVGNIMTANHKILIDMGLSHETLVYLCDLAIQNGALGAKVTGGGRGGYMVALTPGKELQDKIASIFEKEDFKVIRATIGGS